MAKGNSARRWASAPCRRGAFETGFGAAVTTGQRRFHVPFISMTAADVGEFRQRHGDPATPQHIADQLRLSLEAWQEGQCDGVVTYCLDKRPTSQTFSRARELFREFKTARPSRADGSRDNRR